MRHPFPRPAFALFVPFAACLAVAPPALAQTGAAPTALPPLTVTAPPAGSLTVPDVGAQRRALSRTAGSIGFVDSEDYKGRYAHTLRDVLADVPGMFVQNRFGQELRLSVRGSGIARAFHARGIEILQDGIPFTLADGSGDFYQIDPLAARSIEVYKGGNGLAYGTSSLGGAVNVVSPTARTAIAPNVLRLEGGSFGTARGNVQVSRVLGDADFLFNGTVTRADGFRDHERTRSGTFNLNVGYRLSPDVETRFYAGAYVVDQEQPGALSLGDALHRPTIASAAALAGDQARDTRTERIANRTTIALDAGRLDLDFWTIHKELHHPIFQVLDQDGWTYGAGARYSARLDLGGFRDDLIVGARFVGGRNEALQFVNIGGMRGAQTLDARQDADNYEAFVENRFWVLPDVALMAGAKLFHHERDYADQGGLPANPHPKSDSRDFSGINPKIGLLWEPGPDMQVFAALVRSQDVPDFTDLAQTIGTTTRFVPLKAQDAWTAEIGTRGRWDRLAWDVTAYRSWVRGELLQFTIDPAIPATTFNAGRTVHQGIEFGLSVGLLRDLAGPGHGDRLALRQLWTYSDFRFDGDRQFAGNRIAGVPEHLLRTTLSYTRPDGLYVAPIVDWVPEGPFADHANTLRTPGYVLLGLEAGLDLPNGLLLFVEARNLADARYVADLGTITDARAAGTQIFYPGAGRAVFAGIRYGF